MNNVVAPPDPTAVCVRFVKYLDPKGHDGKVLSLRVEGGSEAEDLRVETTGNTLWTHGEEAIVAEVEGQLNRLPPEERMRFVRAVAGDGLWAGKKEGLLYVEPARPRAAA